MERQSRSPQISTGDGRVSGICRFDIVYAPAAGKNRPLYTCARADRTRQTPIFCFGPLPRRIRPGRTGRKPCGAPDQNRGQSRTSRDTPTGQCDFWSHRCNYTGSNTRPLRPGPHAGTRGKWACEYMDEIFRYACDRSGKTRFGSGPGIASVDRNSDLASFGQPDPRTIGKISQCKVASI